MFRVSWLYCWLRGCDFPFVPRSVTRPAGVLSGLKEELARVLSVVFPDDCFLCGQTLRQVTRYPVCERCIRAVEPMVAEFACLQCRTPFVNDFPLRPDGICALCRLGLTEYAGAWSYGLFEGPLARLIHLFKYRKMSTLDRPLAGLLLKGLPPNLRFDLAVPVPLHWWKHLQRGFNQSELLTRELSRRSGIPFADVLKRSRHTPSQTGLSATARRRNVAGAFGVKKGVAVDGRRVLLIDDVLTTGATLAAASRVLKQAGAARVTVLTLARADRRFTPVSISYHSLAATSGAT